MSHKILFVDDEVNILTGYKRRLRGRYEISTAESGAKALALMEKDGPFAVVISDMRMPEMNGVEYLGQVKQHFPDTVCLMLTGNSDQETAIRAINEGQIFRFYGKPCPHEDLAKGIDAALAQYDLVTAERTLLEKTLAGSVKLLVDVLALSAPEAVGKARLVQDWAVKFAKFSKSAPPWKMGIAAMLSPIGNIVLPEEILAKRRKGEKLTATEHAIARRAPEVSRDLIANIPRLEAVSKTVYYQHKNFDGSGFPEDDVSGEDIAIEARILRILNDLADLVDICSSQPPYAEEIAALGLHVGRYDPIIAASVQAFFASEQSGLAEPEPRQALEIQLEDIHPGDILMSDIKTDQGVLVLASGYEISPVLKEKMKNFKSLDQANQSIKVLRLKSATKQPALVVDQGHLASAAE